MKFQWLGYCLTLVVYGASVTACSLLVAPFLRWADSLSEPAARARALLLLRLAPTLFAVAIVIGLFLPGFLWLEPRQTQEHVSPVMFLLAAAALGVLLLGTMRGVVSLWMTHRLVERWKRRARAVHLSGVQVPAFTMDEPFPLVTVVGILRPSLFIANAVYQSCDHAELAAIAAHETAHLYEGDHWKRLLIRSCPDVLSLTPIAAFIERRWAGAAEQIADEIASRSGPTRALDLASALVKVARLVGSSEPEPVPTMALYRGDGTALRVARLLELSGEAKTVGTRGPSGLWLLPLLALPGVLGLGAVQSVHQLMETIVRILQ